jgi:hypothetical protein
VYGCTGVIAVGAVCHIPCWSPQLGTGRLRDSCVTVCVTISIQVIGRRSTDGRRRGGHRRTGRSRGRRRSLEFKGIRML